MIARKIIITGGHLTPALATIEELRKQGDWEIYYLGRERSFEGKKVSSQEAKIIPASGINFIPIRAGRLQRRFTLYTIPSLLKIPFSFFQSLLIIGKIKPDLILSFGGYVSVPIVIAGWIKKIPVITHEQTSSPGLANKINSHFSDLIAVSFKETLNFFSKKKTVFTGNPLREEIFEIKKSPSPGKVEFLQEKLSLPLIYVTGGSQGASIINKSIMELAPFLLERALIIHQTGELDYIRVFEFSERLPEKLKERYFVKNYISKEEIGWVLNRADLVISRSGANIVWELGALGKPAILIPLPIAGADEQMKNAILLKKIGLAEIIPQKDLSSEKLRQLIEKMILNIKEYKTKVKETENIFFQDGAKNLVCLVYELLKKRKTKETQV